MYNTYFAGRVLQCRANCRTFALVARVAHENNSLILL